MIFVPRFDFLFVKNRRRRNKSHVRTFNRTLIFCVSRTVARPACSISKGSGAQILSGPISLFFCYRFLKNGNKILQKSCPSQNPMTGGKSHLGGSNTLAVSTFNDWNTNSHFTFVVFWLPHTSHLSPIFHGFSYDSSLSLSSCKWVTKG